MPPKTVGIIANTAKRGVAEVVRELEAELRNAGIAVHFERQTARLAKKTSTWTIERLAAKSDLLIVLGGDGTILNVVGNLGNKIKPIFGLNIGSLGFLTCQNSSAFREAVESIRKGEISYSNRALLAVDVCRGKKVLSRTLALNDAVITRGHISRLIRLSVAVNAESLTEFNADGLIVATPTGSTAYSLSAGGPIITPNAGVFVITPICPHVLTNRSVVVSDDSTVDVQSGNRETSIYLTVDGRSPVLLEHDFVVRLRRSEKTLPLAAFPHLSFFKVLRQKLRWTGSNV